MALLEYGSVAGLAYRHNWDAEMQRQNVNEQADRQAQIDSQNKAMILGDKLKFAHASNTWDNKLLKEFSENRVKEIGAFAAQNPNFMNDAGLWAQFGQMTDELTNNDIVYRSLRIQQNYESLTAYIQQNPGAEADPAIQQQLTEYDNYIKFGSIDGNPTSAKEFMFKNPDEQFDPLAATAAAFSQLAQQETYDKGGVGIGATRTGVPEAAKYSTAVGLLNGPDGYRYNNAWGALSEADKQYYQNDPVKWIMGMGSGYTASGVKAGAVFAPQRASGSGSGDGGSAGAFSPYLNDFGRLQKGGSSVYSPNVGALLPIQDGKMPVTSPLRVKVINADGTEGWKVLSGYTGSVVESNPTGNVAVDPSGQPIAEVSVRVPITQELGTGENALLDASGDWFFFEPENYKNNPAYQNVATVETNADGESTGYAFIRTWVPTSADPAAIRNYDMAASTPANATKAEGYAVAMLTAQERINSVTSTRILPDGRTIGMTPQGNVIDMLTGQILE